MSLRCITDSDPEFGNERCIFLFTYLYIFIFIYIAVGPKFGNEKKKHLFYYFFFRNANIPGTHSVDR